MEKQPRTCSHCHGEGKKQCTTCQGTGRLRRRGFSAVDKEDIDDQCFWCNGQGWITCSWCDGTGKRESLVVGKDVVGGVGTTIETPYVWKDIEVKTKLPYGNEGHNNLIEPNTPSAPSDGSSDALVKFLLVVVALLAVILLLSSGLK